MAKHKIKIVFELEGTEKKVEKSTSLSWSPEVAEDLSEYHSVDAIGEIKEILAEALEKQCDKAFFLDVLNELVT